MRQYAALFKMRLIAGFQYRAAAWAGVATQFAFGFVFILTYDAFYRSSAQEPPMPWEDLVTYLWLQQAFLAIIMLWWQDGELLSGITDGHVAYELCRPYDMYAVWYARLVALRLSSVLLRCGPILIITVFLPARWRMHLPAGPKAAALFLLSLALSLLLVAAVSMFVYILTFITLSPVGARLIIGIASEFLQGSVIPIPLMPKPLQQVLNFFPFRYAVDLPFRLYSGNIAGSDALVQLGIQLAWVVGLVLLGYWAFGRVLKKVVIQGG
ncbi:MAG: ABC-2 family transporter protein [Oscillospiraceae bacterium]|nr:ABC-2 family transporter protein [Oscillospiraceae bacterium]